MRTKHRICRPVAFVFAGIASLHAVSLATLAASQEPGAGGAAPFRTSTQLVVVPATVTDAAGRFVTGLAAEDFSLFEDDVERPIRQVALERVPVAIAVVVDISASMAGEHLADARNALALLTERLAAEDEIAIVTFNDRSSVLVPWTKNRRAVVEALERLSVRGDTSLYVGVEEGLRVLARSRLPRRALLVLSDGIDTQVDWISMPMRAPGAGFVRDNVAWQQRRLRVLDRAQRSGATIYAVAPAAGNGKLDEDVDVAALRALTEPSGGYTVAVGWSRELPAVIPQVAHDLAAQYLLGFEPARGPDGRRHSLRIATANPAYRVRARNGYQAETPNR